MSRTENRGEIFFIIGGGIAGMTAGIWLRRLLPSARITLFEREAHCGDWLRRRDKQSVVIGNTGAGPALSMAGDLPPPPLLERALAAWPGDALLDWLRELDTKPEVDDKGTIRAQGPLLQQRLLEAALEAGITIREKVVVHDVRSQPGGGFRFWSKEEPLGEAGGVIFATGGERNHGLTLAREAGLSVRPPRPGHLRLRAASRRLGQRLEGLTKEVRVVLEKSGEEEHGRLRCGTRGLEGPVISALTARTGEELARLRHRFTLKVDWIPEWSAGRLRTYFIERTEQGGRQAVGEDPLPGFSVRHWNYFLEKARVEPSLPWARTRDRKRNALIERLKRERIGIDGMGLPRDERAWTGGVEAGGLVRESGRNRALDRFYCCGEMLDFLYPPGGYHPGAVWASAYHTASGIAAEERA